MTTRLGPLVLLAFWLTATPAIAETHSLRLRGKTLIEAEYPSAKSEDYPRREACKKCSGRENLGFFWKNSWFEIDVELERECTFLVWMQTSSNDGTSLELWRAKDGSRIERLELIDVPKTGEWTRYRKTDPVELSLAAGKHTLRFQNSGKGANVDFICFEAKSVSEPTSYRLPKKSGPNKNPLKGFCSGWWRPDDDYATVGFQYIEWGKLEPRDDEFDWDYVEEVLHREGSRGRHVILQFVVDWDYRQPIEKNYVGPRWLLDKVGEHRGHADPSDPASRPMRATKYNEPVYVAEATEAIAALADYFHDDPRIFVLQAGLLGFWSEWHTFPRQDWSPNDRTKKTILDTYLNNLPANSFTQIRYPDEPSVEPQHRVGYTNGSATPTDHGYAFGREIERRSLWKNGPITGEWPPNVEPTYWERFFLTDEGKRFISQARYSTLLMPEAKDIKKQLATWEPTGRFLSMHRQLGYDFCVESVRQSVSKDGNIDVEFSLKNVGIAPFYQDWEVQLAILSTAKSEPVEIIAVDCDLRELGPGNRSVLKVVSKTRADPRLSYQIGLRLLQPGADQPKSSRWALDARNVYIALSNDIMLVDGVWDSKHRLQGGWNVIGDITRDNGFPFAGSVRPTDR